MFLPNYNYGIKFIDLIDYNNPDSTFTDLVYEINKYLQANCKDNFYVDDEDLWIDFIKRFTRRFMYRTLSFDTYFEFCIKLNDVFTKNKVKLQNMYKVKLIEFNPLYNKYLKTDTDFTNDTIQNKNTSKQEENDFKRNENGLSNNDSKSKNNTTTKQDNYTLHSDAPRSAVKISDMFEREDNYIVDGVNNHNEDTSDSTNKSSNNSLYSNNMIDKNKFNSSQLSIDNIRNKNIGKELLYGYDKNPTDILNKYIDFVVDCNEYLLSEIEKNHLFMNIII